MVKFANAVLRFRRWVVAFWLILFLAGGALAGQLSDRLSFDFSLPGQEGYETEKALIAAYGTTSQAAYIPVVTVPAGQTVASSQDRVKAVFDAVRSVPGLRVVDQYSTGDPAFVSSDGRTAYAVVYAPMRAGFVDPVGPAVEQAVAKAAQAGGVQATITGYAQLAAGSETNDGPSLLTETLIGGLGALAVLAFVFASFLALVPLFIAAVAILSTFLIVLGLTTFTDVSFVVQFLISLVGLGVAVDYSLLVVTRWREERDRGAENRDAVITSVRTAGNAVVASGVTVAISLLALIVVPVPLLRSMGYGGMLIPLVSVAVVLTLLPVMLATLGPRVDRPRLRHEATASRGWTAWARLVLRRPWAVALVAGGALAISILPATHSEFGSAGTASLASNGPAVDALHTLEQGGIGTGVVTPLVILVDGDGTAVAKAAAKVAGVHSATVAAPGRDGKVAVDVIPSQETVDSRSVTVLNRLHEAVHGLPGVVGIAGTGATILDYQHAVYDRFPYVIALISVVTFLLLVRAFRSLLLPAKAVLLNLLSLGAVIGASTWFWQDGHGSQAVFGIAATGAMTFWIPPLIFAFLFGLSMDYEVFILARMREEYDASGSTAVAVEQGLGRTGRLVTSAALILFFAFAALASAPGTDIKVFATALGVGILLDATVVRALLVPALISLFGKWNWWLPEWAARVLRVEPSPLEWVPPAAAQPAATAPDHPGELLDPTH